MCDIQTTEYKSLSNPLSKPVLISKPRVETFLDEVGSVSVATADPVKTSWNSDVRLPQHQKFKKMN